MAETFESFCNPTRRQSYATAQNVSNDVYIIACSKRNVFRQFHRLWETL